MMRRRLLVLTLGLAIPLAACVPSPSPYRCTQPSDCAADQTCSPSGVCVGGGVDGSGVDGSVSSPDAPTDAAPVADVRLCMPGVALPREHACARAVCDRDATCCDVSWDATCVLAAAAEPGCAPSCPQLLAGGSYSFASAGEFDGTTFTRRWPGESYRGNAYNVAWGDLDADGLPDLAVGAEVQAGWTQAGLVVYRGAGYAGTDLAFTAVPLAGDPVGSVHALAWRDFDVDGDLDLLAGGESGLYLAVNGGGAGLTVHRLASDVIGGVAWADRDGAAPWSIAVGHLGGAEVGDERLVLHALSGPPYALDEGATLDRKMALDLAWCDVTGDGRRDLAIAGAGWERTRLALATTDGFATPTNLELYGYRMRCADLDRDGDNDLIVAGDSIVVARNQGGFGTTASWVGTDVRIEGVAVGDVDRDGLIDVVVSDDGATDRPLTFFRNTSTAQAVSFDQRASADFDGAMWSSHGIDLGPAPPR